MSAPGPDDRVYSADEVAQRLNRALLRAARILAEVRQSPGLYGQVAHSRHLNAYHALEEEMAAWRATPAPSPYDDPADTFAADGMYEAAREVTEAEFGPGSWTDPRRPARPGP